MSQDNKWDGGIAFANPLKDAGPFGPRYETPDI